MILLIVPLEVICDRCCHWSCCCSLSWVTRTTCPRLIEPVCVCALAGTHRRSQWWRALGVLAWDLEGTRKCSSRDTHAHMSQGRRSRKNKASTTLHTKLLVRVLSSILLIRQIQIWRFHTILSETTASATNIRPLGIINVLANKSDTNLINTKN